jgi:hypothetical protein
METGDECEQIIKLFVRYSSRRYFGADRWIQIYEFPNLALWLLMTNSFA